MKIAERWAYPSIARGFYRVQTVKLLEYDLETKHIVVEGEEVYSFLLNSDRQEGYYPIQLSPAELEELADVLRQGLLSEALRLVAYFPWPLMAGPLPPEELQEILAPVFVDLSLFKTETQTAVSYNIYLHVQDMILSLLAVEFDGVIYVPIEELDSYLYWFSFGIVE
jgi:hypothetical protein